MSTGHAYDYDEWEHNGKIHNNKVHRFLYKGCFDGEVGFNILIIII